MWILFAEKLPAWEISIIGEECPPEYTRLLDTPCFKIIKQGYQWIDAVTACEADLKNYAGGISRLAEPRTPKALNLLMMMEIGFSSISFIFCLHCSVKLFRIVFILFLFWKYGEWFMNSNISLSKYFLRSKAEIILACQHWGGVSVSRGDVTWLTDSVRKISTFLNYFDF